MKRERNWQDEDCPVCGARLGARCSDYRNRVKAPCRLIVPDPKPPAPRRCDDGQLVLVAADQHCESCRGDGHARMIRRGGKTICLVCRDLD